MRWCRRPGSASPWCGGCSLHAALTWIMAGTSSSHIASYSGHHERSHSGGPVQNPPDGSGFRLQPTNPISLDTPPQLGDRAVDGGAGRLRELAHRREVRRVQVAHPTDELVLVLRPERRRVFVADVVGHPARPRREQREIGAALALELQLRSFPDSPGSRRRRRRPCPSSRRRTTGRGRPPTPGPRGTRRHRVASSCSARDSR